MRSSDRERARVWLLVGALALFPIGAGGQQEPLDEAAAEPVIADASPDDERGETQLAEVSASGSGLQAGIETITVTVQRRSQNLQEVPAAATAIIGPELDAAGITQLQDIQAYVPSMHYGQERGEAKVTLRGVSNAQGTDQSTAIHIDGIYQNRARAITSLTLYDVERVEVLRGPQGTLYGRNATGGAMNIISMPPSSDFEALGDIQVGNYRQRMVRSVLNLPLVDDVASVRVSGFWEDRDGYQENFHFKGTYQDADDADDFGIRTQVLVTPSESVETTLRFNYAQKRGVGYALKRDGPLPAAVDFPILGSQNIYEGATPNPGNDRHVYLDAKASIDNTMVGGNVETHWQVPKLPVLGATRLLARGSFSDYDENYVIDQDYSDLPLAVAHQMGSGSEWVGELDWSSDYDGNAGWLLGVFHFGTQGTNTIDAPAVIPIDPPQPPPIDLPVPFHQDFNSSAYSVAGFADGWYDITDTLRVEAGVRYSHDWKTSGLVSPVIFLDSTTFVLFQGINDQRSDDWGEPTGSISLDYQITDASRVYGRFATGYKAGTLNNDLAPIGGRFGKDPDCDPDRNAPDCDGLFSPRNADPEYIYALEAGSKNNLLDNRLLLNGTAFIYWYRDLQVSQLFEAQYFVENAATARIYGVELESTWRVTDPLTIEAQFSFLETKYTKFKDCIDAKNLSSVQDCTGNELSRAPRFSGRLTATYEFDFARFGSVTPLAQIYASDEVFFRPTNEPVDAQDAYCLLNFRIMWQSESRRLGLDLFIDNALDKNVATTKIVGSSLLGSPLVDAYDRPRTIGARASIAW